jgi:hypothetical protein
VILPWIVAYLLILVLWALMIRQRPGPTLWKGRSLLGVNLIFVAFNIAGTISRGHALNASTVGNYWCCVPRGLIVFDVLLVIVALALCRTWVLLKINQPETIAVLERCFTQTRTVPIRHGDEFLAEYAGKSMTVTVRPNMIVLPGALVRLPGQRIRFAGAKKSKKAALVRSLFGKQFSGSLPTPRFKA